MPEKRTLADWFYIWSDGKTLTEMAKEHGMTKVEVACVFFSDLSRLCEDLQLLINDLKKAAKQLDGLMKEVEERNYG